MSLIQTASRRIGACLLLAFLAAACAPADASPTPAPVMAAGAPSPTPFQPQPGEYESPFNVQPSALLPAKAAPPPTPVLETPVLNLTVDTNPLTGLPPADPILLERRPLAVKVSNYPREIRPQFGLTLADQVFEYYIEWGATRFIAIFYGHDAKQVGPVRSGRYFDEHVTRMYHAFFVFNFADPRELNFFKDSDLQPFLVTPGCVDCTCPPFFIYNPNRLADERHLAHYFDTTRFSECNAKKGVNNSRQPLRNGFFSETVPRAEYRVKRIYIKYSSEDYHYWKYDPATSKYLRYQEAAAVKPSEGIGEAYAPLMDSLTNRQVDAQNVVVLFVTHTFSNTFNAEDEVYHINLIDWGRAIVFRDGIAILAHWYRPETDQPLVLTTTDGSPIFLRPGRTFYEVIGASSTSSQDEEGWYFQFKTP